MRNRAVLPEGITETLAENADLSRLEKIDLIAAGFPCQDISLAGKGAGLSGERSSLWWKVRRAIRLVRPPFALLENVAALLGRGMGTVLGHLAALGYDAEWHCIPASAVGAPHFRDRVWIIANANGDGLQIGKYVEKFSREAADGEQTRGKDNGISTSEGFCSYADGGERPLGWKAGRTWGIVEPIQRNGDWEITAEPTMARAEDGVPNRLDRLAGIGNAVVPQIPEIIGRAIMQAERLTA